MSPVRAFVPWKDLTLDVTLPITPVLFMIASFLYDVASGHHDYFQRSGAVMVFVAGYLAYRSLNKHWLKAESSIKRGVWARTSKNQAIVDGCTLAISILGTIVWGYGDKIYVKILALG
jgi:hypothetical protein